GQNLGAEIPARSPSVTGKMNTLGDLPSLGSAFRAQTNFNENGVLSWNSTTSRDYRESAQAPSRPGLVEIEQAWASPPARERLTPGMAGPTNATLAYLNARKELEELQRSQQILNMKMASERIDVDVPKSAMVEIVDQAKPEPAKKPAGSQRI